MKVNIHVAKTNLSRLIARALEGEEITIAKAGCPLVRLTPIVPEKPILGTARGTVKMKPGWDSPLTDKEMEEIFSV